METLSWPLQSFHLPVYQLQILGPMPGGVASFCPGQSPLSGLFHSDPLCPGVGCPPRPVLQAAKMKKNMKDFPSSALSLWRPLNSLLLIFDVILQQDFCRKMVMVLSCDQYPFLLHLKGKPPPVPQKAVMSAA